MYKIKKQGANHIAVKSVCCLSLFKNKQKLLTITSRMTQKIEARRFSQAYFTDRASNVGDDMWKKVYVNRDRWRCI